MRRVRRLLASAMRVLLGNWLAAWLQRKGMEQQQLAELCGVSGGTMSLIIVGKRRPNRDDIPRWPVVMGLNEEEARQFTELAYLAHCPDWIVREYLEMKTKLVAKAVRPSVKEGPEDEAEDSPQDQPKG